MSAHEQKNVFLESAEEYFSFLEKNGFAISLKEPTRIRYQSNEYFINVYHGRRSAEIALEVGSLKSPYSDEAPYLLGSILKLFDPEKAQRYRHYATREPDGIRIGIKELASIFRPIFEAGLFSRSDLFERLQEQGDRNAKEYAYDVKLSHAREHLIKAWQEKDFASVVKLLAPFRKDLTKAEEKKFDYALKRTNRRAPE